MNIIGQSFGANYPRPQASAGAGPSGGPVDSVGSAEPGGLIRRPVFASSEEATPGQRRSLGAGRAVAYAVALGIMCAGATGCATVNRKPPHEPAPVATQAGQAVRDFHENVNKPIARGARDAARDVGHWFRDRAREFKQGFEGK